MPNLGLAWRIFEDIFYIRLFCEKKKSVEKPFDLKKYQDFFKINHILFANFL